MPLEHLQGIKETGTAADLQKEIKKALGEKFKSIAADISFDLTKLAPGVIVEVEATYKGESTYIYIRENYDLTNITAELTKHQTDDTAVEIDYVGEGKLPISNKDVLGKLKDAIHKLNEPIMTSAAIEQMSFSGDSKLTPGGGAVTVTVTYPGNTLAEGHYDTKTIDIKVKESEKPQ